MSFRDLIGPDRLIDPAVIQVSAARGDDWYPYAAKMPLTPEALDQPKRKMTTFILHSMAGPKLTSLDALWRYCNRPDITGEPTWIGDLDGRVAQLVPVDTRADNNYLANQIATSIETQDRGSASLPTTPWSDPLMAQLAGLAAWQVLHPRLNISLRRADDGWDGGGIDGHRRYPEWSKYVGKTCPGDARWNQIPDILAAARWIVDWTPEQRPEPDPPRPPQEDDVAPLIYIGRRESDGVLMVSNGVFWHRMRSDAEANGWRARIRSRLVVVHNVKTGQPIDLTVKGSDFPDLDASWQLQMGVELSESKVT